MPQLARVNARTSEEWASWREKEGERGQGAYEVMDGEVERRGRVRTPGRVKHGRRWPGWWCIVPGGVLWLVLQDEAPLHPSVGLSEVGGRLLLAAAVVFVLGLVLLLIKFFTYIRDQRRQWRVPLHLQNEDISLTQDFTKQQACACRKGVDGPPVPIAHGLLDCLLLFLLHEPMVRPDLLQIRGLVSRLEAVAQTLRKSELVQDPLLQGRGKGQEEEGLVLMDRVTRVSEYLQDRTRTLCTLLQVQCQLEASVRVAQEQLQQRWVRLEELHTRVTLSPALKQSPEDPSTALSDTECLGTELQQLKSTMQQCEAHLNACSQILKELDQSRLGLCENGDSETDTVWSTELLHLNNEKLHEVQQNFTALEHQTSTFVTHLTGLEVVGDGETTSLAETTRCELAPREKCNDGTPQRDYRSRDAENRPRPFPIPHTWRLHQCSGSDHVGTAVGFPVNSYSVATGKSW
ncbi:uncharacterized protein LOC114769623 [Denticeps clupeoides]|uniref:uncharacterized protein LOC114769623 n=1 Tax=Denticeps clupeoides TaxID=299321 RepID=UPI0010A43342|nr:uncharacterized protein LOC114769623 [Denticeps clupeoides]